MVSRFDVHLISLDPVLGSEMNKVRPCVVVSPDEMNGFLRTVVVAPLTSVTGRSYPFRVNTRFENRDGQIALDQLRAVDRSRLVKKLGRLRKPDQEKVLEKLKEMFAP